MAKPGPERDITDKLLAWYGSHARDLPWRAKLGEWPDPYRVWLSEIMLQQTTVAAVCGYFLKFTEAWPTVDALAAATLDDVLRAWAGLGYYARARNLHACAKVVTAQHGGVFPATETELLKLPGIGRYTAGAIAAIAFGAPTIAVDGNVERVISRLYANEMPLPGSKLDIRARTLALVPGRRAGDFAQALMDLGATVCMPKRLNCLICPCTDHCEGRKRGIANELPKRAAKKPVPVRKGIAFWIERDDGAILLRRRPEKGLLGGMMEIPSTEWQAHLPAQITPPLEASWSKSVASVEHTFTHFHLELEIWRSRTALTAAPGDSHIWVPRDDIHAEALPSLMRKIVSVMMV